MLSSEQVAKFQRDGYLVIPDFATPEEVTRLYERGNELVRGFEPKDVSIFSTKNQNATTDRYFIESAGNVSFFFEEGAFDESGELNREVASAINKIGHALHDADEPFRELSRSERVAGVLRSLGYERPLPVQSMYIFKQPGIGGEVVPHQDASFLETKPRDSVLGLWLALEDARVDNGCLWTLPGSHTHGVARRFVRTEWLAEREARAAAAAAAATAASVAAPGEVPAGVTTFIPDEATPDAPSTDEWASQEDSFVPVEVKAGTLVLLDGCNVHRSGVNTNAVSRNAYTMHIIEGGKGLTWTDRNWLQRSPDNPFVPIYDDRAPADSSPAANRVPPATLASA